MRGKPRGAAQTLFVQHDGDGGGGDAEWLNDAVLANDLLVEAGAEFGSALLGFEIDVDDAEAFVISVGPLVVIEQTPDEVTFHGDALRDGAMELAEVDRKSTRLNSSHA